MAKTITRKKQQQELQLLEAETAKKTKQKHQKKLQITINYQPRKIEQKHSRKKIVNYARIWREKKKPSDILTG